MLFWPKMACAWVNVFLYTFWVTVLMIGIKDFSQVGPIRYQLIKRAGQISCRVHLFVASLVWIDIEKVEDCGYEKWLGPDWKPKWEGTGTIVTNHVCWMDIVTLLYYVFPSFVSKKDV